jgi:septal ring factor EnvC (AmiA/AmiB activator)
MDSLDDSIKTTFLKNFEPGYQKSEPGSIVSKVLLLLNNIESICKINQVDQGLEQLPENTNCDADNLLTDSIDLDSGERPEIEDRVELLCEQIETLKQLLQYKELELQQIKQELRYTNEDLCAALNSPWVTLDEAKQLVKQILVSKKPVGETLAKLLRAIYNSSVKPSELEQIHNSHCIKPSSTEPNNCISTNFEALKTKITDLKKQGAEVRAKSRMLREYSQGIQAQSREVKAQFNEVGIQFVGSQASFMRRQGKLNQTQAEAIHLAD